MFQVLLTSIVYAFVLYLICNDMKVDYTLSHNLNVFRHYSRPFTKMYQISSILWHFQGQRGLPGEQGFRGQTGPAVNQKHHLKQMFFNTSDLLSFAWDHPLNMMIIVNPVIVISVRKSVIFRWIEMFLLYSTHDCLISFSCLCGQGPNGDSGEKGEAGRHGDPVSLSSYHTWCYYCFQNFLLSCSSLFLGSARIDGPSGSPRTARQCGMFLKNSWHPKIHNQIFFSCKRLSSSSSFFLLCYLLIISFCNYKYFHNIYGHF